MFLPGRIQKLAIMASTAATGVGVYSLWLEPRWLKVKRLRVGLPRLPGELEGLTIAHLTDFHVGPHVSHERARRAIEVANGLQPDVVALTGDYVSASPKYIDGVCEVLSDLQAPMGVYAVLGNHDHWEDADATRAGLEKAGIVVLDNDHRILKWKGVAFVLAGLEDLWEADPDFSVALEGVDDDFFRIVLAHNPDVVARQGGERVDLLLCGHTHGGQVRLPFLGAPLLPIDSGQKLGVGLTALEHGTRVYVNAGVGVIFPPVRFLCRPEVAHITLTREAAIPSARPA